MVGISQLKDTHFPSNVDALYRQLGHLNSLSAIPDTILLDDDLHGQVVSKGFDAETNMNKVLSNIVSSHPLSMNWRVTPEIQFRLDDLAQMEYVADMSAAFWNAPMQANEPPAVSFIDLYHAPGNWRHVAMAVKSPTPFGPSVELFDPHGHFPQQLPYPLYKELKKRVPGLRFSHARLQEDLGKAQRCDTYGMCAYLSAAVLDRKIQNMSAMRPHRLEDAAVDIQKMVRGDAARSKKLDYWMLGSMARGSQQSTRKMLGLPPPSNKGKRSRFEAEVADPSAKFGRIQKDAALNRKRGLEVISEEKPVKVSKRDRSVMLPAAPTSRKRGNEDGDGEAIKRRAMQAKGRKKKK